MKARRKTPTANPMVKKPKISATLLLKGLLSILGGFVAELGLLGEFESFL
jgi:hypothetical protein